MSTGRANGCWTYFVNTAWERQICDGPDSSKDDVTEQIQRCVASLKSLNILQKVPGRSPLRGLLYSHTIFIRNPKELVDTLKTLCDKDVARQMNEKETDILE